MPSEVTGSQRKDGQSVNEVRRRVVNEEGSGEDVSVIIQFYSFGAFWYSQGGGIAQSLGRFLRYALSTAGW